MYYSMYDALKLAYSEAGCESSAPLLAGSSARMVAAVVVSPLEMVRTNAQAKRGVKGVQMYRGVPFVRNLIICNDVFFMSS